MTDTIRITLGKGFHLTIGDYAISVQIGHGNYCARQDYSKYGPETDEKIESSDCEIAIWRTDGDRPWITNKIVKRALKESISDEVMGWVTPLQVGQIIAWMTKQEIKRQKEASE